MNIREHSQRVRQSGEIDLDRTRRRIDFSRRFLLFIPVETQRSRRALVVGYYLFFLVFAIVVVSLRGPQKYDHLLPLSFYLATLLGGLTFTGPVRLFSHWQRGLRAHPNRPADASLGLHSAAVRPAPALDRLDEHDIALRDRAHYLAYSALRWPAILAAMFGFIFFVMDATPAQMGRVLLIASVPFAVLFFSLPQAIILWTDPDLEPDPVESTIPDLPSGASHA